MAVALIIAAVWITGLTQSFGQTTNLVFTSISVTDEGAMHIAWSSVSNEIYEIDEADALINTNTGSITWNELYNNYPSQGTNTFWLDTGNYFDVPAILHPKDMPMRFYRIVDKGPDTTSDEPTVAITSPTNATTVSGELTITVAAETDQPVLTGTKLYVDGQEMLSPDSSTNYTDITGVTNYEIDTYNINTCEWGNETHTLFATAKCASSFGDELNGSPVLYGYAVSPFVPVLFNNLVTRLSFSQPFFDPSSGETQEVSAVFALDSDWTLNIENASSNIVFSTTGSGISMSYNWDGTGTGETNLPNGTYYYYVTAATNGLTPPTGGGSGGGINIGSPPSPEFASESESSQMWAASPDSETVVPLVLYPPGFDTNELTIFSATPSEVRSLSASSTASSGSVASADSGFTPDGIGSPAFVTPLASPQSTPQSPQRPPNNPVKGVAGQFGVGYQDYSSSGLTLATPYNGFPVIPGENAQHVHLNGTNGTTAYNPYLDTVNIDNFITQMKRGAWQTGFVKANSQLLATDLESSSTPFNQYSLGMLSLHGAYGTSIDYNANQAEQIYFPIDGRPNNASSWVGMNSMNFGAPGTNGLKWMAILACNDLRTANWTSMQNAGITPFNGNLHLLLGCNTTADNGLLDIWAKFMLGLDNNSVQTIMQAWQSSEPYSAHGPVGLAVAGYDDCENDVLTGTNGTTPSGNIFYQAFTPQ